MASDDQLRVLVIEFFRNIGSVVVESDNSIIVSNVPREFEEGYGRPGPYTFSINTPLENQTEMITRGSVVLQKIGEFLSKRGTTSCVKLLFPDDYLGAFQRHLRLRNASIVSISCKEGYDLVYRFTFQTIMQYLNEKEQLVNHLYFKDGHQINFSIDDYSTEAFVINVDHDQIAKNYEGAKLILRELINPRVIETSKILGEKLLKEESRIKSHYDSMKAEHDLSIKRIESQIAELTSSKQAPAELLSSSQKIEKLRASLDELRGGAVIKNLEKELDFFLSEESQKHSLNLNNKLVSTTIIACPVYTFTLSIKSSDGRSRFIDRNFDPLTKKLYPPFICESCSRETVELSLCDSSHLSCVNCSNSCSDCHATLCLKCLSKTCDFCAKKLCRKCSNFCSFCRASICKSHARIDFATAKSGCTNCLKQCGTCKKYTSISNLAIKESFNTLCKACDRLRFLKVG